MCGICGVVDWSDASDAAGIARRMTPTMFHRGPDDEGYLESGRLALGMRRLSIIDLAGGHQPIFNEDGNVGVVLNGEIYNFRELRAQLVDRGHAFRTHSDSEVVAHAYEEWGAQCVERLQGMFAFAVHDRRSSEQGTLFIARDRFGIKPLYYSVVGHSTRFLFASEVRTLLASDLVLRRLSRAALESYLLFGSVSEPMTLVEDVYSLPPGHRLTINLDNATGQIRPECYWKVGTQQSSNGHASNLSDATAHVRELLADSVRKHLIADVPVGVFLSSGIDSTSLAALASREVSGVHSFTVAFEEKEFSEAAIARATASKLGTTHQEVMLSADEMLARLGDAVGALDQPSIDGINTYFVSWSARQAGLKVALSGLGGDEVFGGYTSFGRTPRYQQMAAFGQRAPGLSSLAAAVAESAGGHFISGDAARKISAVLNGSESLPDPFYFGRALFTPAQVAGLLKASASPHSQSPWWNWLAESSAQARRLDSFAAVSCMELQSYLVSTLLRDTDSMSMAHSLEVRVPFLDHPLVEFVTGLPQEIKSNGGTPKSLLVAALRDLLPENVVNQKKRGFTLPWATWLRGSLKPKVERGFSELSPALSETVDAGKASGVWSNYLEGKTSWSRPWSLYVLNEWTKKHLT